MQRCFGCFPSAPAPSPLQKQLLEEIRTRSDDIRSRAREEALLRELPTRLQRNGRSKSWQMLVLPEAMQPTLADDEDDAEVEETPPATLDSLIEDSLAPMPIPLLPQRVVTDDVKEIASKVLMPHLLQKNVDLTKARTRLRKGEISAGECRKLTRDAGRQFDLRYAATIRAAKEVANETGEVPLRRIVSSDESWSRLQQFAQQSGLSLANFTPHALRTVQSQAELEEESSGREVSVGR